MGGGPGKGSLTQAVGGVTNSAVSSNRIQEEQMGWARLAGHAASCWSHKEGVERKRGLHMCSSSRGSWNSHLRQWQA